MDESSIDFPIFLLFFNTKFPIFPTFSILSFLFSYFFLASMALDTLSTAKLETFLWGLIGFTKALKTRIRAMKRTKFHFWLMVDFFLGSNEEAKCVHREECTYFVDLLWLRPWRNWSWSQIEMEGEAIRVELHFVWKPSLSFILNTAYVHFLVERSYTLAREHSSWELYGSKESRLLLTLYT